MSTKTEILNELYDAALVTGALFGVAQISKAVFKDQLGVPTTMKGALKLTAGLAASFAIVQQLQRNKLLPDDPFK